MCPFTAVLQLALLAERPKHEHDRYRRRPLTGYYHCGLPVAESPVHHVQGNEIAARRWSIQLKVVGEALGWLDFADRG